MSAELLHVVASIERLRADLDSGAWHRAHGHLLDEPTFDGSLRLLVARP